ncbi:hypothetical protein F4774DRAFT_66821 [Daldinia eschscholtzii]|nr:hypothetical protein F4774DRAFT_66821 [Daldinia eschscholtzii]
MISLFTEMTKLNGTTCYINPKNSIDYRAVDMKIWDGGGVRGGGGSFMCQSLGVGPMGTLRCTIECANAERGMWDLVHRSDRDSTVPCRNRMNDTIRFGVVLCETSMAVYPLGECGPPQGDPQSDPHESTRELPVGPIAVTRVQGSATLLT